MREATIAVRRGRSPAAALGVLLALLAAGPAGAQPQPGVRAGPGGEALVQLDFNDAELAVVIDTIARMTGKNFIYDDRVRGRVTIVSPTEITVEQAYAVFESVLQVKGFTTVEGPGGAIKVIPIREAKESSVDTAESTRAGTPNRDRYVTRLIPLQYIDAEAISNTLKPLVSKDASMVAYAPTNTIILTDSASNIRRLLSILDSVDVETYREELAVIQVEHADASSLAEQLAEIYGDEATLSVPTSAAARVRARRAAQQAQAQGAGRQAPRIITDVRTNSLIILASRQRLEEIRGLVNRLDVPITGEGRIQVYYLKHADSEELAQTLNTLLSAQPQAPQQGRGAAQQALQAAVAGLGDNVTVTADPATNALVIQGSKEAYQTLAAVIDKLDIQRPQVLVEALIMEVDVTDRQELGFNGILRLVHGNTDISLATITDAAITGAPFFTGVPLGEGGAAAAIPLISNFVRDTRDTETVMVPDGDGGMVEETRRTGDGTIIQGILRAAADDNGMNILSAPHILTSDNEEAEIKIGNNIPIVTSRVQSAAGIETAEGSLATSQNIERRDIGVTLRVTPQISEGDTLRMEIFQEITDVNRGLTEQTGGADQVGVALSNRKVENTVVVADNETVVIGGLLSDNYSDNVSKIPFLGDIPVLGWLFKSKSRRLQKQNLLVFLTPHIIRKASDLEYESIRKREEFRRKSRGALGREDDDEEERRRVELDEYGLPSGEFRSRNPARNSLDVLEERYPLERMQEIEEQRREAREAAAAAAAQPASPIRYRLDVGPYADDSEAAEILTDLLDAGYDSRLVSRSADEGVVYGLRVGPYAELEEAERVADVLRKAFELQPAVVVERREP